LRRFAAVQQLLFHALQLFEDDLCGFEELCALFGQIQATGVTQEKRNLQLIFQRADLAADRRLTQGELLARVRQASGRGDGVKDAQAVEVHAHSAAACIVS
jgi:hypothetical protein